MDTRTEKRAFYAGLLRRRQREGLTYRELAEESGLPASRIGWWCRRLEREQAAAGESGFVEVTVTAGEESRARYALELVNGRRIEVSGDFEADVLVRLVRLLETC